MGVLLFLAVVAFQWAPTLGGECYLGSSAKSCNRARFQWAPTLGGECYFNTHSEVMHDANLQFQWAPTLGGECYSRVVVSIRSTGIGVSMGTHPWG